MNELKHNAWSSPDKDIPVGTLVRFVHAPARFKGEDPREPSGLEGTMGIIIENDLEWNGGHNWGGLFRIGLTDGRIFDYYGDFLEPVA